MPTPVALALGSNLGDRGRHLDFGRRELARSLAGMRCSAVYETEPREMPEQPPFLNACCVGATTLDPEALLARCKEVERRAGRPAGGPRYGPRVLDVDVLLFGDRVIEGPGIRVPHPRLEERPFVLVPLAEVAPGWVHPVAGVTVAELARRVGTEGVVRT